MANRVDDQCDFDELSALLDEEEDILEEARFEASKPSSPSTTPLASSTGSPQASSSGGTGPLVGADDSPVSSDDDDIDDDELDRLAALVQADPILNGSKPDHAIKGRAKEEVTVSENDSVEEAATCKSVVKGEPCEKEPSAQGDGCQSSSVAVKQEKGGSPVVSMQEGLDELAIMREKVKLLEAQLLSQGATQSSPQPPQSSATAAAHGVKASIKPKGLANDARANSSLSETAKKNKTPPRKNSTPPNVRLAEEDLFGSPTSPEQPKNLSTKSTSSKHAKPGSTSMTPPNAIKFYGKKQEDSDSDWDDLDGEKTAGLSKPGKEMKKLLNHGPRNRVAHEPKPPTDSEQRPKASPSTWKNKPSTQAKGLQSTGTSNVPKPKPDESNVMKEYFSGIRIINPLVSSDGMRNLMEGRRMIRMCRLHNKIKSPDLEGDWVTMGVVVNKSEPKVSAKGNQYSIWKLSDLEDCEKCVSLFLFGNVHKQHWKMATGSVVGILNASLMQQLDKDVKFQNQHKEEISITVDNPLKIMNVGRSRDFGLCKAKTKAGRDCNNFINKERGEFCTFHVQSAYKKHSSKRAELQAGHTGVAPKSFEQRLFGGHTTVMYQGQSYTSETHNPKKKRAVSLKGLQSHQVQNEHLKSKVTTLAIHDLIPEDKAKLEQIEKVKDDKHKVFHEMLTTPSVGSMNFVKHLKHRENTQVTTKDKVQSPAVQVVSARQFFKQSQNELTAKFGPPKNGQKVAPTNSPPLSKVPSLARGLRPGDDIFLDMGSPSSSLKENARVARARQQAVAKLTASGGVAKKDPNAIKKDKSKDHQEKIKKRLADSMDTEESEEAKCSSDSQQPPKKKSKLFGDLNLDSAEAHRLLNARSKHDGALTQEEQEKQDLYFDALEKKEQMEEKMRSIREVPCKAVTCKQCDYTALSQSQRCRDEKHKIVTFDTKKRFFVCSCGSRLVSLQRFPVVGCNSCGRHSWQRTSMLREKNGPKLPQEELLLRGEECKFLNSLQ